MAPGNLPTDGRRPRIGLVVQRYGEEVNGGAEQYARQLAERLAAFVDLEVITTCAVDFATWQNVYPPGQATLRGVAVRRFPVDTARDWKRWTTEHDKFVHRNPTLNQQIDWVREQGPFSSELLAYLHNVRAQFDGFIFVTYQYATTVFGLPIVGDRAVLVPTAHDDPFLKLDVYRSTFRFPKALVFLTEPERDLVYRAVAGASFRHIVAGSGLELPQASADRFRRKHDLPGPFLLYVGRIHEAKNVPELLEFFQRYQERHPSPLKLVLIGQSHLDLPRHPDIIPLGFVSDREKADAIKAATVLVLPSLYESLSIAVLEAWSLGVPVLVNGRCEVLRYQCRRANGGLYYMGCPEFEMTLSRLVHDPDLAGRLGSQGRAYVSSHYRWDVTVARYRALLETIF
jgi:glycosyltransferase involved in cell wall biosynthesis